MELGQSYDRPSESEVTLKNRVSKHNKHDKYEPYIYFFRNMSCLARSKLMREDITYVTSSLIG